MASAKDLSGNASGEGSGVWALLPRDAATPLPPAVYTGGSRQRPEILSAKPTAAGLWHSLRRRMPLAVGLGLLTAILIGALVWLFVPVRYEAYAIVRVAASTPSVMANSQPSIDFENYKRSQAVAIKTPKVLYAALQQPEISNLQIIKRQADPASWLADKLLLDFPQNGEFLRVALRGDEANELAPVVNAIVKAYMAEVVEKDNEKIRQRRDLLEKKVNEYQEALRKKKEQLQSLADSAQTPDSEAARANYMREQNSYQNLQNQCLDLDRRIFQIDVDSKALEILARNARSVPDDLVDAEVSKDARITALENKVAESQAQLSALRGVIRNPDRDPGVQQLQAAIGTIQSQIEDRKQELRTQLMQGAGGRGGDSPQQKLQMLKVQREEFVKQLEESQKKASDKLDEVKQALKYSGDLEMQKGAARVTEDIAGKLLSEYELAKIEAQTPTRVSVYNDAEPPKENDASRKYLIMMFGSILGFSLVVLGVSRMEFQNRHLNSSDEITEGLGLRLMGDLPPLSRGRGLFRSTPPAILQGMVAESIDGIRMALIHDAAVEGSRVVMVTSSMDHEGKTTVACNLAASLARSGRRTLLIDGNLRNPSVHHMFELPLEPGFCEMLRGETDVDGATVPTSVEGLFVLPAGYCDGVALQALAKCAPREVFERLRTQYEFVIIDGAPVLTVADALSFARYTDGAILSVRRDVSQIPKVYEASERLKSVGMNVTGVVVNGVHDRPARAMYAMSLTTHENS